jgi:hypothetical protein
MHLRRRGSEEKPVHTNLEQDMPCVAYFFKGENGFTPPSFAKSSVNIGDSVEFVWQN